MRCPAEWHGAADGGSTTLMDPTAEAAHIAQRLGPLVLSLAEPLRPRLLATLERRAADRYDTWAAAAETAAERDGLQACAARERRIAELVEARYAETDDEATRHAPLVGEAAAIYLAAFEGRSRAESFAIQAALERAGAAAWRGLADSDAASRIVLLECAALEEASAAYLDQLSSRG